MQTDETAPGPKRPWLQHWHAVMVLGATLLLLYARVGDYGYIDFDDTAYIEDNLMVRQGLSWEGIRWAFGSFYAANWHPLTWISHMADVSVFGMDLGAHHLVNVALHGVVSLLVYSLFAMLLARRDAALAGAMLFLVHPQHVESVVWLAERKDLLCATFYLLAILAYCRYERSPTATSMALVAGSCTLALLSKPMAVSLPLILLLLDIWPLGRLRRRDGAHALLRSVWPLIREKLVLFGLVFAACGLTLIAQTRSGAVAGLGPLGVPDRLLNVIVSYGLYLRDFALPDRLAIFYPLQSFDFLREFLPAALALFGTGALCSRAARAHPGPLLGFTWFIVTLLPVIGLVQVGAQSRADRYMYIPSIGLLLGLVSLLPAAAGLWRTRAITMISIMALFWGTLCYLQIGYWESPGVLYKRTADVTRDNIFAETRLLDILITKGELTSAEVRANGLIERFPHRYEGYMSKGEIALAMQRPADAEIWFLAARERAPEHWHVINDLAIAVFRQGRHEEACALFAHSLKLGGESRSLRQNLATGGCLAPAGNTGLPAI
jgi:protein O-mannosyl-transferase